MTGVGAPSTTSDWTNMPGRSLPSEFASVAWTWMLRVDSSTIELTAVIFPVLGLSDPLGGYADVRARRRFATCCCGTVKFT